MTKYEAMLLRLAPASLSQPSQACECPAVSHCAGTAKLLGEGLGAAVCETLDIRNRALHDEITSIACLIRAFIVLDDFAKDKAIDRTLNPALFDWIDAIREETRGRLRPLTTNADALWSAYEADYHDAYRHFRQNSLFIGVVRKCCPIFLPLRLDALPRDERTSRLQKALEEYLFCLQAMDDFMDMEEDAVAPQNHNIFLVQVSPSLRQGVMVRRGPLARALLPYVQRSVTDAQTLLDSRSAVRHFDHSLTWLEAQQRLLQRASTALRFQGSIRRFRFRDEPEVHCLLTERAERLPDAVDLRAERMHTVMSRA